MKPSIPPTLKRLVATQAASIAPSAEETAARVVPQLLAASKSRSKNDSTAGPSRSRLPLQSYTSMEATTNGMNNTTTNHQSTTPNTSDYYNTSSFETALNQVLQLKLDCPSRSENSHHDTMESCVRDFFRVK